MEVWKGLRVSGSWFYLDIGEPNLENKTCNYMETGLIELFTGIKIQKQGARFGDPRKAESNMLGLGF